MGNWDGWVIEKVYMVDEDGNILGEVKPFAFETIDYDEVCENNKDDKQEET